MKTKLMKLRRCDLVEMYYYLFTICSNCIDFMEFVPKYYLIEKIMSNYSDIEIKEYLNDRNLIS